MNRTATTPRNTLNPSPATIFPFVSPRLASPAAAKLAYFFATSIPRKSTSGRASAAVRMNSPLHCDLDLQRGRATKQTGPIPWIRKVFEGKEIARQVQFRIGFSQSAASHDSPANSRSSGCQLP